MHQGVLRSSILQGQIKWYSLGWGGGGGGGEAELSCDLCLLQYVQTLGKIIGGPLCPAPVRR